MPSFFADQNVIEGRVRFVARVLSGRAPSGRASQELRGCGERPREIRPVLCWGAPHLAGGSMARALSRLGSVRSFALATLVAGFTATCGSDGETDLGAGGAPEAAPFSLTLEPTNLSLPRGASAWISVTVEREAGFVDPVAIRFEGLPEGWVSDTLTLPATVSSGTLAVASSLEDTESSVELSATASSGSQRASAELTVESVASEPSSQEKIRAALAGGSIDYETSLVYRAYALFGDARLPDEFLGAGSD